MTAYSNFGDANTRGSLYVFRPEEEALRRSVSKPGATFIVGGPGTGKTTLLYRLLDKLRAEHDKEVLVFSPRSIPGQKQANENLVASAAELRNAVIVVDEAHTYAPEALLNILRTGLTVGAHVVVATQKEIYTDVLRADPALEEQTRIIELMPLDRAQTDELLRKRAGDDYDVVRSALEHLQEPSPHEVLRAAARLLEQRPVTGREPQPPFIAPLDVVIDPGDCTPADLATFYTALSNVYRAYGGEGLDFKAEGDRIFFREGSAI